VLVEVDNIGVVEVGRADVATDLANEPSAAMVLQGWQHVWIISLFSVAVYLEYSLLTT
jgi:hypothetical protein